MSFDRKWSTEVREALTAAQLAGGLSASDARRVALAGELPNVSPDAVPPQSTIAQWATSERRKRRDAAIAAAPALAADGLDLLSAIVTTRLLDKARRLQRSKGNGTPKAWADLAAAGVQAEKLRRALSAPEGQRHGGKVAAPEPEPMPRGFLDALADDHAAE